jgi:hypothetical protein
MIRERNGLSYHDEEREFVKYFNRLRDTEKTFDEIEAVLPQLKKFYYEMVVVPKYRKPEPTLQNLFKEWKYSIEQPF